MFPQQRLLHYRMQQRCHSLHPSILFQGPLYAPALTGGKLGFKVYSICPDLSIVPTTVEMEDLIERKMLEAAVDGPLTDAEAAGSEDDGYLTDDEDSSSESDESDESSTGANAMQLDTPPAVRRTRPATQPKYSTWELFDGPVTDCDCEYCKLQGRLQRPLTAKDKERIRKKIRKQIKREATQKEKQSDQKAVTEKRVAESLADALQSIDFDLKTRAPVTATGYVAKSTTPLPHRLITLSELRQDPAMTHYAWDGRVTHLILDRNKTVIAVLLGQPRETPGWDKVHDEAVDCIKKTAVRMGLDEKTPHGRRGPYPSVAHGISYGGGQPASVVF
ncbi:hypothetical protein F5887DRAFT_1082914 [Amanita rubescens]|nr:hypothetical protein F5887DRAFT_1082914 [Amanita rubescens]